MAGFAEVTTPKARESAPKTEPVKTDADPAKATTPAKAAPKVDPWEKAPTPLKNEYFKLKRESEEKHATLEKQIKEFREKAGKETVPAVDTKAVEQYQKQIKDYQERLSAADYRQSQEFQEQFVQRWQAEYDEAIAEVKAMALTSQDADGNVKSRPATEADLQRVRALPPGEQDKAIHELFGHYSPRVFARLMELRRIERASNEAVTKHVKNAEAKAATAKAELENTQKHYDKLLADSSDELAREWPEHFAPDEKDPEVSAALKSGYEFVDGMVKRANEMTPEDRAAHNAVLRARAAAFLPERLKNNRLTARVKELETELAKFRESDPGGSETPGDTPLAEGEIPSGIAAASKLVADNSAG